MSRQSVVRFSLVAFALAALFALGACVDETVTQRPVERDLTVEEIRTQLQSGSFREKLAAKKQIGKLERAERLRVLRVLVVDRDRPTRTIAVQELKKMLPDPEAAATLAEVAAEDPDPEIRALAAE